MHDKGGTVYCGSRALVGEMTATVRARISLLVAAMVGCRVVKTWGSLTLIGSDYRGFSFHVCRQCMPGVDVS